MCLYCFLLYVREIWAHIDISKCPNISLKIVAPAVSSILRARILKLNFLPLYLIKLIFFKPEVLVFFSLYLCVKYRLIWTYFSTQTWNLSAKNHQSWLPKAQFFFIKMIAGFKKIKEETRVENLRCGAAIVTKIVKNT